MCSPFLAGAEVNKATLDAIETSLVVLSFDPAEPVGDTGVARAVLSGDATHRWYDKVIQVRTCGVETRWRSVWVCAVRSLCCPVGVQ